MRALALLPTLVLAAVACDNPLSGPGQPTPDRGEHQVSADTSGLALTTDAGAYTFTRGSQGYEGSIPFRFHNTAERTVYVVNCNRIVPPALEKRVEGEWVLAWSPAVPQCLSPPIVIEPGEVHQDTLKVFAGYEGSNVHPQFEGVEVEGRYRLLWPQVLWSFDPDQYPFGPEVPRALRTSNEFTISVEP